MTAIPGLGDLRGRRALVYSMGIEGRDLAAWLIAEGARVTISDTRSDDQLRAANARPPAGVEATVTGGELLAPDGFDLVAVSQSVLRYNPAVVRARELGIPVISQMQLFLRLCPGRVVGITGSNGKSTTTALVGAMAQAAGVEHIVGGNIGDALLGRLDEIGASTTVVLEISHTQLQYIDRGPDIAAVTNVTPNHLDQFRWEEYVDLKRAILARQYTESIAILNADNEVTRGFFEDVRGELRMFSVRGPVAGAGAWFDGERVWVHDEAGERALLGRAEIRLPGRHNLENVVAACAIARAAGWPDEAIARAARAFRGVAHRLEVVGRAGEVTWINDSIATSPERTAAGLRALEGPVVVLLGGRDKDLPKEELARVVAERCRAAVCFGEAGDLFAAAVREALPAVRRVGTLAEAVAVAAELARPGDTILLAPGGTSFDAYPNFEARGEEFRRLVRALPGFSDEEVSP